AHAWNGSGASRSSSTWISVTGSTLPRPPLRRATPVGALTGRAQATLASGGGGRVCRLRRRQVPPGELAFLAVGLAESDGKAGFHELLAQVKGMARLGHVELGEDLGDVGPAHEALRVEDVDPLRVSEDPVVEVRDLLLHPPQLGLRVDGHGGIACGDEPAVYVLGQALLPHRVVHQAPR